MRSIVASVSLVVLVGCASGGRKALPPMGTPPPIPDQAEEDPLDRYPELLRLPGRTVHVSYVPGALDRAAHVQRRLETTLEALEPLLAKEPVPLLAVVLDREGWEKVGLDRGWGLPERVAPLMLAVPAEGDPDTIGRMRSLTGGWLPEVPGVVLRGTPEGVASLMVSDALLELEAAGALRARLGLRGSEPWVTCFLDHVIARLAWERTDPGGMAAIAGLFDRLAATAQAGLPPRLEDYRDDLPYAERLGWQAALLRGADLAWVEKGNRGLQRWLRARTRTLAPVTPADLEEEFRDLADWRATSFAP